MKREKMSEQGWDRASWVGNYISSGEVGRFNKEGNEDVAERGLTLERTRTRGRRINRQKHRITQPVPVT